jgi:uncharacterized protein
MIKRGLEGIISKHLFKGKTIVIQGARQVGKTTLLRSIQSNLNQKSIWLDCDEPDIRDRLAKTTSTQLKVLIGSNQVVFIDEAQRVEDIGITLKLITDNIKGVQLIVTGSSAIELSGKINETLTGRKFEFALHPFSSVEIKNEASELDETRHLETRLIYGLYPDVVNNPGNEPLFLKEIVNSYLYKDLLMYKDIRKPHIVPKLLQAIALQLGSEVSYNELSKIVEVDRETIERYIDLLEKMHIVFRINSFSRNLRVELNKSKKIYFWDTGIRNALIANYNPLSLRNDTGALWENYLIVERQKRNSLLTTPYNTFFWRTHQQQEIDYIEETGGMLFAYEFKWSKTKRATLSKTFSSTYQNHKFLAVNQNNYWSFIE